MVIAGEHELNWNQQKWRNFSGRAGDDDDGGVIRMGSR